MAYQSSFHQIGVSVFYFVFTGEKSEKYSNLTTYLLADNLAALNNTNARLTMGKYDYLREEYPQVISKELLRKICGIAKDTAWVYLNSGVIPCEDSGRKARRYNIHIDDVITFLEKRDAGQIPTRSELKYYRPRKKTRIRDTATFKQHQTRYFNNILKDVADAVSPGDMADIIGLSKTIIQRHILHGYIDAAIAGRNYIISKESILAFMLTNQYLDGKGCSEKYKSIVRGLSSLEANLRKYRDNKREAQKVFDNQDVEEQLGVVIQHYRDKLDKYPEILTVHDLNALFHKSNKFTLELLRGKKIRSAKVEGKYLIPKKSIIDFLEGSIICTMLLFQQHLWAKIDT